MNYQEGDRFRSLVQSDLLCVDEVYIVVQVNRQAPGEQVYYDLLREGTDEVVTTNIEPEWFEQEPMDVHDCASKLAREGGFSAKARYYAVELLLAHGYDDDTVAEFEAWCARRGGQA